jgi:hypothetical protein
MNSTNKYILAYERYRQSKLRPKHRKEREKQEKLNRTRMEREKGFGSDDPVSPVETDRRLDS